MAKVVDERYLQEISLIAPIREDNFTNYEFTEVIYRKGSASYLLNIGIHKETEERAVPGYDHQSLCAALGKICPFKGERSIPKGVSDASVTILNPQRIRELSQVLAALPKIKLFDETGGINISILLALLRWIPGMDGVHLSYMAARDEGVAIAEGDLVFRIMVAVYPEFDGKSPTSSYARHTTATMICAAYAVLLMVIKTINANAVNQLDIFIDRRIRALCHTLGLSGKSIDWENKIKPLLDEEELRKLNEELGFFPRLKKVIFVPVIDMLTPELQHMNLIFQETSMTIFSLIAEFWMTSDITRLHVSPLVLVELPKWQKTMHQLVALYGTSWRFYKLIDPRGTLTAQSNFRTLGCAALSWKRLNTIQSGQTSLAQLQGVKINPEFEKLASIKLKPEFVGTNAKSYLEIVKGLLQDQSPYINMNWSRIVKAISDGEWVEGRDF
uniref:Nucleoprotein n=1 Tax=Aedes anphevirus TaxID=2230910 RepID=A0A2Z4HFI7_9MONO|nr:nucleoprotein [Aedes anphevirus]AWW13494.1 nucleoprotein [Aedes anphevirus]